MKRSERLQLRLTPYEKAQIAARALEAGMKLSDYARHRLLGKRIARTRTLETTSGPEPGPLVKRFEVIEQPESFKEALRDD